MEVKEQETPAASPRMKEGCCSTYVIPVRDTLNVISGKWKLPIIGALLFGNKRFGQLERDIPQITPRMLSKELKELELNGMVVRRVYDTTPVQVEYQLTASGYSLESVLEAMKDWGNAHRDRVLRS